MYLLKQQSGGDEGGDSRALGVNAEYRVVCFTISSLAQSEFMQSEELGGWSMKIFTKRIFPIKFLKNYVALILESAIFFGLIRKWHNAGKCRVNKLIVYAHIGFFNTSFETLINPFFLP